MQKNFSVLIAIALILSAIVGATCVTQIDAGHRGVKTVWGKVTGESLPEGLYFYNRISSNIYPLDCRTSKFSLRTNVYTKDVQQSEVQITINYNLDPLFAHDVFEKVGADYASKIIQPQVLSALKDTFGKWEADKIIANREKARNDILTNLKETLQENHIQISSVMLDNIDFSDQYERAIEEKQIATQNAIKAVNKTRQIEEEAKQKVLTAQAEAESMRIRSQALSQNQNLVQYEAVQKWDGKLPVNIYGSAPIPFLSIGQH